MRNRPRRRAPRRGGGGGWALPRRGRAAAAAAVLSLLPRPCSSGESTGACYDRVRAEGEAATTPSFPVAKFAEYSNVDVLRLARTVVLPQEPVPLSTGERPPMGRGRRYWHPGCVRKRVGVWNTKGEFKWRIPMHRCSGMYKRDGTDGSSSVENKVISKNGNIVKRYLTALGKRFLIPAYGSRAVAGRLLIVFLSDMANTINLPFPHTGSYAQCPDKPCASVVPCFRPRVVSGSNATARSCSGVPVFMFTADPNDPCQVALPTPQYMFASVHWKGREAAVNSGARLRQRIPQVIFRGEPFAVPNWFDDWAELRREATPQAPRRIIYELGRQRKYPWLNATLNHVSVSEQAQSRYLLDIGGRSGTSWGTLLWKLRSGSLVFHASWPCAKDWYHQRIKPFEHYVPVNPDLSDLGERYKWAEENEEESQQIANKAKEFAEKLLSDGTCDMENVAAAVAAAAIVPHQGKVD